ncbi:hypothetical protein ACJJTC_007605 [Scirpophaga incertulas]
MARQKKLSDVEKKLKKKEYDRKRREKMKNNTESLEKLREKERDKKAIARKNLQRILDDTPPQSPALVLQQGREDIAARNRRHMRRRRAILYARIVNLEKKVKNAVKLSEKYKKRYLRLKTKNADPESPKTKVNVLLKNVQVPDIVKKKLLFGEALSKDLKTSYDDLGKKHEKKKKYYNILKLKLLQKYKLLHEAKPFFKHDTSKRQKPRQICAKMLKVKDDVIKFLEKDENTRMCPGKRDYLKSKEGKKQQKRVLYDTLHNLHQKFLGTVNYKISLATFCRFKPFWITWQNVNERNTCKCVQHANIELMISKLHELKALKCYTVTAALATVTCNVHSTKCLFRECSTCKERTLEYYLPMPNQLVTYRQWIYEVTSFEKDGKQKTVRKPVKKEYRVKLKQLVQDFEAALPLFFKHVGTIAHQYQAIQNIKNNLTINDVLIHVDYSENYCCKYNEEIQAVHFGGARQQITMHTGVLYLRNNDAVKPVSFCSLSSNNRHDTMAVWAHLKPIFDWIKTQHLPIYRLHMLSDGPVNQYKNKYMFEMVCRHLKDFYPEITHFSWHYSEPGHGKGAPDGVGGTLKRTADKVVAEGHDIVDLNSLKPILQSRCPSILLFEVTSEDISLMDDLIKQSRTIPTFPGTQKIRQFVFFNNTLQCRRLSCTDCKEDCTHYHLGYFQQNQSNRLTKRRNPHPQKSIDIDTINIDNKYHQVSLPSSSRIQAASDSHQIADIGDHVLVKWGKASYPGEVLSVFEDGLMVRCMKRGLKFWKWPTIKDEQLYRWEDVIQKIKMPKLIKGGNYVITELDGSYLK